MPATCRVLALAALLCAARQARASFCPPTEVTTSVSTCGAGNVSLHEWAGCVRCSVACPADGYADCTLPFQTVLSSDNLVCGRDVATCGTAFNVVFAQLCGNSTVAAGITCAPVRTDGFDVSGTFVPYWGLGLGIALLVLLGCVAACGAYTQVRRIQRKRDKVERAEKEARREARRHEQEHVQGRSWMPHLPGHLPHFHLPHLGVHHAPPPGPPPLATLAVHSSSFRGAPLASSSSFAAPPPGPPPPPQSRGQGSGALVPFAPALPHQASFSGLAPPPPPPSRGSGAPSHPPGLPPSRSSGAASGRF
jgi:hypothetical protein